MEKFWLLKKGCRSRQEVYRDYHANSYLLLFPAGCSGLL